jgi:CDP-diacylglycerol--glycerol-3-phosphate 3-phosphatidyltransferase
VQRIWTISNLTSISRIVFVLPAAYCLITDFPLHREWAVFFILVASFTDFLDGYLARKLHQITDLGKIIDPLADKIGIGIVALCLVLTDDIPLWFFVVVLARDALIFLGGVYINRQKGIVPQSNMAGKIAVNIIALALLLSILRIPSLHLVFTVMIWLSIVSMTISLVIYAKRLFIGRIVGLKN